MATTGTLIWTTVPTTAPPGVVATRKVNFHYADLSTLNGQFFSDPYTAASFGIEVTHGTNLTVQTFDTDEAGNTSVTTQVIPILDTTAPPPPPEGAFIAVFS